MQLRWHIIFKINTPGTTDSPAAYADRLSDHLKSPAGASSAFTHTSSLASYTQHPAGVGASPTQVCLWSVGKPSGLRWAGEKEVGQPYRVPALGEGVPYFVPQHHRLRRRRRRRRGECGMVMIKCCDAEMLTAQRSPPFSCPHCYS